MVKINPQKVLSKSPRIKVWVNAPNGWDVFTGVGKLWIVDLKKGVAKKPIWLKESILEAPYPEYRTHLKTIEEFLLSFFCNNGLDIVIDCRQKEKGIIKFNPPLMDRYKIER